MGDLDSWVLQQFSAIEDWQQTQIKNGVTFNSKST